MRSAGATASIVATARMQPERDDSVLNLEMHAGNRAEADPGPSQREAYSRCRRA